MDAAHEIELSGPFDLTDRHGLTHHVTSIRIFDEGYGVIDVYVHLQDAAQSAELHQDGVAIAQILARLRGCGYQGPDFGHGDLALQDDRLVVLEAPEAFNAFAASKGWSNLAESFDAEEDACGTDVHASHASSELLQSLMRKFSAR